MKTYAIFILVLIGIVGLAIWLGSKATLNTYSPNDPQRPSVKVPVRSYDFGRMAVTETRSYDFPLTNQGQSDLIIGQVSTSCDCTSATIITGDGQASPRFTMHGSNTWQTSLKTNQTAIVRITYEPAIMPVEGAVKRYVTVATNDPSNPKVEFTITAEVTK